LMTLLSDTAYPSFIGEVEALNTTTIRRLIPSARHQLPAIARRGGIMALFDDIPVVGDVLSGGNWVTGLAIGVGALVVYGGAALAVTCRRLLSELG
jgi:hypothetical protein